MQRPLLTLALLAAMPATASTLEISPVLIDVADRPNGSAAVSIRNRGPVPLTLQLRLMRWRQEDGADVLEPAQGAAASPPFLTVRPGAEYVARVARYSPQPLRGEEAFRLLVDELPPPDRTAGTITLAMRHSIPVFFAPGATRPATVSWRAARTPAGLKLTASNAGERRLRVADPQLVRRDGSSIPLAPGLLGYVLGGSTVSWTLPAGASEDPSGASLSFRSERGPNVAPLATSIAAAPVRAGG